VLRAPSALSFESRIYLLTHATVDHPSLASQPRTIPLKDPKYDSDTGRALCKQMLAKYLPYEPHTYQLDGICPALDGIDLLVTIPTGSGKTGYLIMLMLVVREISADETLALGKKKFPKDPAMIVVCPTKALEEDMVCTFHEVVT
jgi:ATP-dependent helicase YprA (DUF1998 family)